jgi:hypothetical protein
MNVLQNRTATLARSILCFGYQECESNFEAEPLARKKARNTRVYDFENEINLKENAVSKNLSIYPNPANESVSIKIVNFNENLNYFIQLREIGGKLLSEKTMKLETTEISLTKIAKGSYLIVLFANDKQIEQNVLIKQ